MRWPILVPIATLLLFSGAPVRAPASDVYVETAVHLNASFFGVYVSAEPHVVWRPRRLGVGAGVKGIVGASQFDLHAAPFARLELGWLYANAGWVLRLASPTARHQAIPNGLFLAAGLAPDLVPFGYGRLGFDLGLEYYRPVPEDATHAAAADSLIHQWDPPPRLGPVLRAALPGGFIRFGLLYTFPL